LRLRLATRETAYETTRDLTIRDGREAPSDVTRLLASIGSVDEAEIEPEVPGGADDLDACGECGGRGWKFRGFRRSVATAGDAGEQALLTRDRVACLACADPASSAAERRDDD
jgi:hypothetical protein